MWPRAGKATTRLIRHDGDRGGGSWELDGRVLFTFVIFHVTRSTTSTLTPTV